MIRIFLTRLLICIFMLLLPLNGFARQDKQGEDKLGMNTSSDIFVKDKFSFQTIAGVLYSPVYQRNSRPEINYAMADLRFIWGLNPELTVRKLKLDGDLELILELTHSLIFEGPGNVISGITCLFRYNLPYRTDTLFPYIQIGGGIVYNDSYKDRSQILLGEQINYNPQASMGLRYLVEKNWSLDAEVMFHHISNGGTNERNTSVNSLGALVGITRYF